MIAFERFFVVARSQTFEEPNIQLSRVRQCIDVPIGGGISLSRINRLFKVSHLSGYVPKHVELIQFQQRVQSLFVGHG